MSESLSFCICSGVKPSLREVANPDHLELVSIALLQTVVVLCCFELYLLIYLLLYCLCYLEADKLRLGIDKYSKACMFSRLLAVAGLQVFPFSLLGRL